MIKVGIATAARLMNKGQQFVRIALQRQLVPFGFALKIDDEKGCRYDYFINTKDFCEYLGITEEELKKSVKADKKDALNSEPLFE